MCGRFGLFVPPDVLEARYDADLAFDYEPRYNVAPGGPGVAAVRNEAPARIDSLRWGLVPGWADDPDGFPTLLNVRAETVAEKPAFRDAFAERRCLIPASLFYEWTGGRGMPYAIGTDGEALFSMAGLWETWSGDGETVRSVAIVTTEANDVVAPIHDRMPVVLEPDEETVWLESGDAEVVQSLLDPYPDELTDAHEVSTKVNDPANDSPEVVQPVGEQSGLGEFG